MSNKNKKIRLDANINDIIPFDDSYDNTVPFDDKEYEKYVLDNYEQIKEEIFKDKLTDKEWYYFVKASAETVVNEIDNEIFRDELLNYFCTVKRDFFTKNICITMDYWSESISKFGKKIKSIQDINEKLILYQLNYYKDNYRQYKNCPELKQALRAVINFYQYLVKKHPEHDFFANTTTITKTLLNNKYFATYIIEDYLFVPFNYKFESNIPDKICFLIKDKDRKTGLINGINYKSVNFTGLKNNCYKNFFLAYIYEKNGFFIKNNQCLFVLEFLKLIEQLKEKNMKPAHELSYDEIFSYYKNVTKRNDSERNKQNKIFTINSFFKLCQLNNYFEIEQKAIDVLKMGTKDNIGKPDFSEKIDNVSMKKEEIKEISDYFIGKAKNGSLESHIDYAIFHLMVVTELRITEITRLKVQSLKKTVKNNEYYIETTRKTSRGRFEKVIITETTYKILKNIILETEKHRNNPEFSDIKDYIFIYYHKRAIIYTSTLFRRHFQSACKHFDYPKYNARNIRNTHMTEVNTKLLKGEITETEHYLLTKHKQIETTEKNYVSSQLQNVLEMSYGITIGNYIPNIDEKVFDKIPSGFNNEKNSVHDGCGVCSSGGSNCDSVLPCLVCKDFITSVEHKAFFEKEIEALEKQKETAQNMHDIEDIATKKSLMVSYLLAIEKKANGDDNE